MPIDIWSIPHDPRTATVAGSYYVLHPTIGNGAIGPVIFRDGRSARALTGRELKQIVAAIGRDIDIEPADDAAREAWAAKHGQPARTAPERGVPAVSVDESVIARTVAAAGGTVPKHASDPAERHAPKPAQSVPASPGAAVDIDKIDDIEALRAIATGLYVDVDVKWNARRIRTEIRSARGE